MLIHDRLFSLLASDSCAHQAISAVTVFASEALLGNQSFSPNIEVSLNISAER